MASNKLVLLLLFSLIVSTIAGGGYKPLPTDDRNPDDVEQYLQRGRGTEENPGRKAVEEEFCEYTGNCLTQSDCTAKCIVAGYPKRKHYCDTSSRCCCLIKE